MYRFACASQSNLLGVSTPSSLEHYPISSRFWDSCPVATEGRMLFLSSPRGVGIAPTIELSVVIGTSVPLLSFPRFHGFGQTNRSPPSVLKTSHQIETSGMKRPR